MQRRHNCSPAASFANCVDTILIKSASANFFSIPITPKCQILICDTLVANERYVRHCGRKNRKRNEHLEGVKVDGTRVGILGGLIRKYCIRIATGLMRLGDWLNLQELFGHRH